MPSEITSVGGAGVKAGLTFKLSDLDSYTEFTNLFDEYRIIAVKLEFKSYFNNQSISDVQDDSLVIPDFYTVIDHNDASAPASRAALLDYETLRHSRLTRPHKRYFKVNTLAEMYQSGTEGVVATKWKQWIDTGHPDLPHYGLKYFADAIGGANKDFKIQPTYTYYFQCRSVQ